MLPGRRFLALTALGFLPTLLSAWAPVLLPAALLYALVCVALFAGEALFGARPEWVRVRRRVAPRLSVGEQERVEVTVANDGPVPLRFELRDTPPEEWEAEGLPVSGRLRPNEEATIVYRVRPSARGRFRFGDLYLRIEQAPGFVVRQRVVKAAEEVRVYPALREIARYERLARRHHLAEIGVHRSRLLGQGSEFERLREYTPDDEYRRIDWKATARRHRPMTRVYEVERSQNVLLVLDAGRGMAGRTGGAGESRPRIERALCAALVLAHVALRAGDRVGAMVVADEVEAYLPPGKGPGQFHRCLELFYGIEARRCHVDYRGAVEQIARRCTRRSLVVFFTDVAEEETAAELVAGMRLLRPTHLPLCVSIQDPALAAATQRPIERAEELYERSIAIELLAERRRLLEALQKEGALVLDAPPEELSVRLVNRYLELKARQLL